VTGEDFDALMDGLDGPTRRRVLAGLAALEGGSEIGSEGPVAIPVRFAGFASHKPHQRPTVRPSWLRVQGLALAAVGSLLLVSLGGIIGLLLCLTVIGIPLGIVVMVASLLPVIRVFPALHHAVQDRKAMK